jgi:hypothetical protein
MNGSVANVITLTVKMFNPAMGAGQAINNAA